MINRKGLTLALELRNYMKLAHPGVSISKPGYLKQRMKLNPDAFLELYKYHNRNFYADSTFLTYKDHLILAADGSDINIFSPIFLITMRSEEADICGNCHWQFPTDALASGRFCT